MKIRPLHDRVVIRRVEEEQKSSGGILIPATAQVAKRLVWGEARGVGASCRQVKVGDQVLFSPEDQHEVEVHGEDLIILRERDVHAVAAERIEEAGFTDVSSGNWSGVDPDASIVYYATAQDVATAQAVAAALGLTAVQESAADAGEGIVVVLAGDYTP